MIVNQGSIGCQNCEYRESYKNQLICQHKASMEGIEALKEFYFLNEVKECDYYFYDGNSLIPHDGDYCNLCGQSIDWEEVSE